MTLDALLKAVEDWQRYEGADWAGAISARDGLAKASKALLDIDIPALRRACQEHAEALQGWLPGDNHESLVYAKGDLKAAADFLAGPKA